MGLLCAKQLPLCVAILVNCLIVVFTGTCAPLWSWFAEPRTHVGHYW